MSLFEIITIFYESLWSFCLLLEFDEDTSFSSFFLTFLTYYFSPYSLLILFMDVSGTQASLCSGG